MAMTEVVDPPEQLLMLNIDDVDADGKVFCPLHMRPLHDERDTNRGQPACQDRPAVYCFPFTVYRLRFTVSSYLPPTIYYLPF